MYIFSISQGKIINVMQKTTFTTFLLATSLTPTSNFYLSTAFQFNPAGGVGAANAMHDAIVLTNRINGLPFHPTAQEMEDVFQEYKNERYDLVKAAFNGSKVHRTMAGQVNYDHQKGLVALRLRLFVSLIFQIEYCN